MNVKSQTRHASPHQDFMVLLLSFYTKGLLLRKGSIPIHFLLKEQDHNNLIQQMSLKLHSHVALHVRVIREFPFFYSRVLTRKKNQRALINNVR